MDLFRIHYSNSTNDTDVIVRLPSNDIVCSLNLGLSPHQDFSVYLYAWDVPSGSGLWSAQHIISKSTKVNYFFKQVNSNNINKRNSKCPQWYYFKKIPPSQKVKNKFFYYTFLKALIFLRIYYLYNNIIFSSNKNVLKTKDVKLILSKCILKKKKNLFWEISII
jgi:hypothetical protein